MAHSNHWHSMATRLMAHMGIPTADQSNRLHWAWHRRAALRIREDMRRNGNWELRFPDPWGTSGADICTGDWCPRSPTSRAPQPPRQATRHSPPQQHTPPYTGLPYSPRRSPLRPFPQRSGNTQYSPGQRPGRTRNSLASAADTPFPHSPYTPRMDLHRRIIPK